MAQLTRKQVEAGRQESATAMRSMQESIDLEFDEPSEITVKVEAVTPPANGVAAHPNSIGGLVAKIVAAVIAIGAAAEAIRQALGK
jgi:hypothetical protein